MTTHLSPDALAELQRLLALATPAPWRMADHIDRPRDIVALDDPEASLLALGYDSEPLIDSEDDVRAIVALRNAAPALIAELVELRRERAAREILEPTPAEALGVINYRLPGGFMQTSGGKELKGWSTDPMAGGTVKHYLDSEDCRALATAFLALGHALESHAPDCIAAPERDARKDGG